MQPPTKARDGFHLVSDELTNWKERTKELGLVDCRYHISEEGKDAQMHGLLEARLMWVLQAWRRSPSIAPKFTTRSVLKRSR